MASQYLMLEDVEGLGHSGDIVKNIKPGYARNYLLPRNKIVLATKHTIRLQEQLQEERQKKRLLDKQESEAIAARIQGVTFTKIVKVDHDGHMYGSVNVVDIVEILEQQAQVQIEKRFVVLRQPIKKTGSHSVHIKLKEGVLADINLSVLSEEEHRQAQAEQPKKEG